MFSIWCCAGSKPGKFRPLNLHLLDIQYSRRWLELHNQVGNPLVATETEGIAGPADRN